jgi:transcriptional regulator with XRE-family HTH domain
MAQSSGRTNLQLRDMTVDDPKIRALRNAAEIVGSEERLARLLKVSPELLSNWLSGSGLVGPPDPVFFKALAIISHPPPEKSQPE